MTGMDCSHKGFVALLAAVAAAAVALLSPGSAAAQAPEYELPPGPQPSPGPQATPYLTPAPVVRLVGRTRRRGTRITMLRVEAPRGSTVRARCEGGRRKGCKVGSKARTAPESGVVRFREMERLLRPGAVIEVFVRRGATVGKYTAFRIRFNKLPRRRDNCLLPGFALPRRCP